MLKNNASLTQLVECRLYTANVGGSSPSGCTNNMQKNLESYLKIYNNRISDEMCDSILAQLNSHPWQSHSFYDYSTNELVTHEKDLQVSHHIVEEIKPLMNVIWTTLQQYFIELIFLGIIIGMDSPVSVGTNIMQVL